jgi:4-amino-4-deoxy-L-arabinose transferase-like glycosyltransferase
VSGWLLQRAERATPWDRVVSWLLFTGAFIALWATERAVGYPRDESYYFLAGGNHGSWFELLFTRPREALTDAAITRWFDYNREHPGLMKNLFGLSHLVFHQKLGWVGSAVGYRLPAFAVAALIAPLSFRLGAGVYSRAAGLFAAIAFFLVPRQFFNAHLAAFDVPVAAFWLLSVYAFWRAASRRGWWLWCGVSFGLALCTKHNTFFLPLILIPFAVGLAVLRSAGLPRVRALAGVFLGIWVGAALLYGVMALVLGPQFLPRFTLLSPHTFLFGATAVGSGFVLRRIHQAHVETFRPLASLWAMAVVGPPVLYALWPLLWHHPVDRVAWWLNFHATHNHYAWFYLGVLQREPPFPLAYVVVKTALTVPTSLFVPMVLGVFTVVGRAVAAATGRLRGAVEAVTWADGLVLGNAILSVAVISHPHVPIFGGVKHWFPSMPFLSILGGMVVAGSARWLQRRLGERLRMPAAVPFALLCGLLFVPALVASVRIHPYGTSYYSEVAGGVPGAASLGMQRQFWSNNVTGVLPWINEHAPRNARVWLHEVTGLAFRDYQRNGLLRADLRAAGGPGDSDIAAYQYHQEFREHEFNIWDAYGTTRPVTGLYVDETPQVIVYQRGRP